MKKTLGIIFTILALACAGYLIYCYTALGMGISSGIIPGAAGIVLAWIDGKLSSAEEPEARQKAAAHG